MIGKNAPIRFIIVLTALVLCIAGLSMYRDPPRRSMPATVPFLEGESHAAPAQANPVPWITIPDAVSPAPQPAPPPGLVPQLPQDQMYVISSSVDCFTTDADPPGLVNVTQNAGPFVVYAKFVGGTGGYELRTYTGKAVICITATGTGRATITVVKQGAMSKADTYKQSIDASNGPAPGPPTPPTPVPPQPGPPGSTPPSPYSDPFRMALWGAWQQEKGQELLAQVTQLSSLYRVAAGTGDGTVNDVRFKTAGAFFDKFAAVEATMFGGKSLPKVRAVLAAELAKTLPPALTPLDAQTRALIAVQYLRVAGLLETLK